MVSLTGSLIHKNRTAEKIRIFDDSPDPTLYDGEPYRDLYQTHVAKRLALVQTWSDLCPGPCYLHAFHLFVGASGRVFRI